MPRANMHYYATLKAANIFSATLVCEKEDADYGSEMAFLCYAPRCMPHYAYERECRLRNNMFAAYASRRRRHIRTTLFYFVGVT